MAWIKKDSTAEVSQELEFENTNITKTDAYEAEITEAYLKNSADEQSKSVSLVINAKTEDGDTVKTYFTVMGRDGNTFFESTYKGKKVKKQHFGLSIANSLFKIAFDGKEIFDVEPAETTFSQWNKEDKEMEEHSGDGFPDLVGKKIGLCVQMIRKISGKDSSEYPEVTHFFDTETGLFSEEEDSDRRKLDRWLSSAKEFKVIEEEAKVKTSFGKKADAGTDGEAPKKKKWGKA